MKSFTIKSLCLILAGVLVGFSLSLGKSVVAGLDRPDPGPAGLSADDSRLLADVLNRIRHEYVEPVADRQLVENAVRGMLTELDSHSRFLTSAEYEEVKISTSGSYSGVGLEVRMNNDQVTVVAPLEGSAAALAGLRAGDVILTVDGVPVDSRDVSDTVSRMRGSAGTAVRISVARQGAVDPLTFALERGELHVHSVHSQLLDSDHGYVRISQFSETTAADLREAIETLRSNVASTLHGLVLDLRGNPGGVVKSAVDVADLFLETGVIVTASGRTPDSSFRHDAGAGDVLDGASLVVLVNGSSASAAEIVAGALQDNGRAIVVGRPTFGKGSVQTVMPLADGRAMKLTTSRYYTPSGVSIQGQGVQPDLELDEALMRTAMPGVAPDLLAADPPVREALAVLQRAEPLPL